MLINRIETIRKGAGGIKADGATLLVPLTLAGDPATALEAVPKRYIDDKLDLHISTSLHVTTVERTLLNGITVTYSDINKIAGMTTNVQALINNKVDITGGTLTGPLTLHAVPSSNTHAANKGYVTTAIGNAGRISIGDIVTFKAGTPPAKFLKCDGSYVSKTTYASLFAVIGNHFDQYNGVNASPSTLFSLPNGANQNAVTPGIEAFIKYMD